MWYQKLRESDSRICIAIIILMHFCFFISVQTLSPVYVYASETSISFNNFKEGLKSFNILDSYKKNNWEKAAQELEKTITKMKETDPLWKNANFYLGYFSFLLENYTKSRDYFDKAKPFTRNQLEEKGISPTIIRFAVSETTTGPTSPEKPWYKKWYWWALIVAVVGGTAGGIAAAGGGSGGGGTGGSGGDTTGDIPISW